MRTLLLLFISLNSFSDVSFGELENFVIESDYDTRKIQIYYPNNKTIDSDTLFIFMNDFTLSTTSDIDENIFFFY